MGRGLLLGCIAALLAVGCDEAATERPAGDGGGGGDPALRDARIDGGGPGADAGADARSDGGSSWKPPAAFEGRCLTPGTPVRPVWECYQVPVAKAAGQPVTVSSGGHSFKVTTFADGGKTYVRFTPVSKGVWSLGTGGTVTINADRPAYARGFLAASGAQWTRTATGEALVPQFVMYDRSDIRAGLDELVDGHGFTGFHLNELRDFLKHTAAIEEAVIETYRRGGVTHFWVWGDGNNTPGKYSVNVSQLYQAIGARLGPIPGWSVGYGYDLWEWASGAEIEAFRATLRQLCDDHHMVGGRGLPPDGAGRARRELPAGGLDMDHTRGNR